MSTSDKEQLQLPQMIRRLATVQGITSGIPEFSRKPLSGVVVYFTSCLWDRPSMVDWYMTCHLEFVVKPFGTRGVRLFRYGHKLFKRILVPTFLGCLLGIGS